MQWQLNKSKPICPQICGMISAMIASGELSAGERLLSVREIALKAGVNPNTVQKSFEELERQGLIHSVRSVGWFVGEDRTKAREAAAGLMNSRTAEYFESMMALGMTEDEVRAYVKEWKHE